MLIIYDSYPTEEAEKPADLSKKIVFKVKRKKDDNDDDDDKKKDHVPEKEGPKEKKSRKSKPIKNLLSFNEEEIDD